LPDPWHEKSPRSPADIALAWAAGFVTIHAEPQNKAKHAGTVVL
jgi:hypothetical protein